jgi:hypothetical protein
MNNLESGMKGQIDFEVTSGTPTITMPTGFKKLGTFSSLAAGFYTICWSWNGTNGRANIGGPYL